MTSHRDDSDTTFQQTIDGLQHTSITTKLSVIDDLNDELLVEQAALEVQRGQLYKHQQKISELTTDLQSIQAGEEYTVGGSGGVIPLPPAKVIYVKVAYSGGGDDGG